MSNPRTRKFGLLAGDLNDKSPAVQTRVWRSRADPGDRGLRRTVPSLDDLKAPPEHGRNVAPATHLNQRVSLLTSRGSPTTAAPRRSYGAHFWLYRTTNRGRRRLPRDAFHATGHEAQFVTIVSSSNAARVEPLRLGFLYGVGCERRWKDLDGDLTFQLRVRRPIDFPPFHPRRAAR